ncbi:MAG TPA: alpha/beta hydrolase [Caulobacteraceae bacterium]|nr:alpha/beta hydrolase [Caulobacteraceae bacterium]
MTTAQPPLVGIPEAPVPAGAEPAWIAGAGGARLRAALFAPAAGAPIRGSVVLSGGRTEPIEKYFETIGELSARGFWVLAHDWRGQGLSERLLPDRLKGHAAGYQTFLDDYRALLDAYEARLPRPWIAVGHSMGGCLTLLALAEGETRFSAAFLSAPMLGLLTGGIPLPVGKALASLFTGFGGGVGQVQGRSSPIWSEFKDNVLTHDPARYARNRAQVDACPDLALGGPTWGWLDFAFKAMGVLQTGPGVTRIAIPVVVLGAGDDRLVDIAMQRRVTARVPGAKFVEFPGAFHELFQETDDVRARVWTEFDALAEAVSPAMQPA